MQKDGTTPSPNEKKYGDQNKNCYCCKPPPLKKIFDKDLLQPNMILIRYRYMYIEECQEI